jgi:hydroxylamine reductase (hybrid-cluster protein)
VGVLATEDEDLRSLRELLTYGVKGIAAYAAHAYALEHQEDGIFAFVEKALAATLDDGPAEGLLHLGVKDIHLGPALPGFLSRSVPRGGGCCYGLWINKPTAPKAG